MQASAVANISRRGAEAQRGFRLCGIVEIQSLEANSLVFYCDLATLRETFGLPWPVWFFVATGSNRACERAAHGLRHAPNFGHCLRFFGRLIRTWECDEFLAGCGFALW